MLLPVLSLAVHITVARAQTIGASAEGSTSIGGVFSLDIPFETLQPKFESTAHRGEVYTYAAVIAGVRASAKVMLFANPFVQKIHKLFKPLAWEVCRKYERSRAVLLQCVPGAGAR